MDRGLGDASSGVDSGARALATLLAVHKIAVDPQQLRHELGHHDALTPDDVLRLAKRQDGVRARLVQASFDRLSRQPLPVLAHGPNGWFLIGRAGETEVLIQRPGANVEKLSREELEAVWSGEIILLTTRESVGGAAGRFDIRWFIPQVVRYRKLIGEVLLITLGLNLLGLAAPLFFQNVIDKVLVHNTLATLQVLSVGFVAVSLWEVAFG